MHLSAYVGYGVAFASQLLSYASAGHPGAICVLCFFRRSSVGWHMPVCLQSARACLLFLALAALGYCPRPFYFGFSSLAYLQHGGPILLLSNLFCSLAVSFHSVLLFV